MLWAFEAFIQCIQLLFSVLIRYISNQFNQIATPKSVERQILGDEDLEAEALTTREGQLDFIQVGKGTKFIYSWQLKLISDIMHCAWLIWVFAFPRGHLINEENQLCILKMQIWSQWKNGMVRTITLKGLDWKSICHSFGSNESVLSILCAVTCSCSWFRQLAFKLSYCVIWQQPNRRLQEAQHFIAALQRPDCRFDNQHGVHIDISLSSYLCLYGGRYVLSHCAESF